MKKLSGFVDFGDGEVLNDEEVYKFLMRHSRFIDRISVRKMVEMTIWSFTLLANGIASRKKWQFYGKNGFFKEDHYEKKKAYKRK